MHHINEKLKSLNACGESIEWLSNQDGTAQELYEKCERGDWLLWLHARIGSDRKILVRACCQCVRQALEYIPKGEDRPRIAIETAEKWADGNATIEEVRIAAADAAAAYVIYHAAAAAAAYAAYAAAAAYDAAAYDAYATYAAAYAAYAAAYAAYAADADAADAAAYAADATYAYAASHRDVDVRIQSLKKSAEIVRSFFPDCPELV